MTEYKPLAFTPYNKKIGWDFVMERLTEPFKRYVEEEENRIKKLVKPHYKVLEIGCGSARIPIAISGMVEKVVGIDNSPLQVGVSIEKTRGYGNIEIRLGDATDIPFDANDFDASFALFNLLGNLGKSQRRKVLHEMKRVTKPDGHILATVYAENARPYQADLYDNCGFKFHADWFDTHYAMDEKGIGVISKRFGRKELEELFHEPGLDVEITSLAEFVYACHATK